jgi:hypothetical protein
MHGADLVVVIVAAALTVAYIVIGASLGIRSKRERKGGSGKRTV